MLTLTIIACTCWAMHSRWLRAYLLDLYIQLGNRPTVTPSMHYTVSIHDPENSQSDDSVAMSEEDSTVSDTLAEQNHTNSSQ